jgi:hypothetical protein
MFVEGSYDQRLEIIADFPFCLQKHGVNTTREEGWRYVKIAGLS